jgi:predicted MPP superfamily phosphohydrolase
LTGESRLEHVLGRGVANVYRAAAALGLTRPYRVAVREYTPDPPGWPPDQRLSIAAIADVHYGDPVLAPAHLRRIVDTTNGLGADLIVLLGDYGATHHTSAEHQRSMADLAQAVAGLHAPLGVFAVLGNHDWWSDADAQTTRRGPIAAARAFTAAGIGVLENDAVRIARDGHDFWLAGLGDQLAFPYPPTGGVDDMPALLGRVTDEAPAILLAHEPDVFAAGPARFALTLSGHTHGGQVKIFGRTPVVPSRYGRRYVYGHIVEDDRHLIVSGGLGVSLLPIRIGVPPEIVHIRLGRTGSTNRARSDPPSVPVRPRAG